MSDTQLQAFLSWAGDCHLLSSKNVEDECCLILFLSTALAFIFSKKEWNKLPNFGLVSKMGKIQSNNAYYHSI